MKTLLEAVTEKHGSSTVILSEDFEAKSGEVIPKGSLLFILYVYDDFTVICLWKKKAIVMPAETQVCFYKLAG